MVSTRYKGTLKKWNPERGFGFILASDSGQDIFVHITAFPRDGRAPAPGEELTFEVEPDGKGKKRAVRVQRMGAAPTTQSPTHKHGERPLSRAPQQSSFVVKLICLALMSALGWYGYSHYASRVAKITAEQTLPAAEAPAESAQQVPAPLTQTTGAPSTFTCDGRKYCSQMTSCKEATQFLQNCPGMEMDGDHDGVPCEQQWCTSPSAK